MGRTFLSNEGRARFAIAACGLHAACNAAHGVLFGAVAAHYGEIEDIAPYETAERTIDIAVLVTFFVAAFGFLFWFRRAYANAHALGLRGAYSPGWAVGAWFVPILNFVRPAQIAFEMWRHAGPTVVGRSSIVGVWWTMFLLDNFGTRVGMAMLNSPDPDTQQNAFHLLLAVDVVAVVGLVLAIVIVRRLTKAHDGMQLHKSAETFA